MTAKYYSYLSMIKKQQFLNSKYSNMYIRRKKIKNHGYLYIYIYNQLFLDYIGTKMNKLI